jgi:hypothetical protein
MKPPFLPHSQKIVFFWFSPLSNHTRGFLLFLFIDSMTNFLRWNILEIPRHSFFLWLLYRDAIVTRHKMCSWGYSGHSQYCLFCHACQESREHIFFNCSFSRRIWNALMTDCLFDKVPVGWEEVEVWSANVFSGKSLRTCLGWLCLAAVVYIICGSKEMLSCVVIILERKKLSWLT